MQYDTQTYKTLTWKNPSVLFWILFPPQAINEILFGQRIPKTMLVERNSFKQLSEKSIIPCPHCNTMHPGLKWTQQNNTAFGNWFGFYCDNCGKIIPCVTNLTSYLILGLTFPLWYWLKDRWKTNWLVNQRAKFSHPLELMQPTISWWKIGLQWGIWMYCCIVLFIPFITGEEITSRKLLTGIPVWLIFGSVYGLFMKYTLDKKNTQKVVS